MSLRIRHTWPGVKNAPRKEEVLDSNLGSIFFFKKQIFRFKNLVGLLSVCLFRRLNCYIKDFACAVSNFFASV